MRIVEPSATLEHCTADPARVVERMGRKCYQSTHKIQPCRACEGTSMGSGHSRDRIDKCFACDGTGTDSASAAAFTRMILANGHESVLEHVSLGVSLVTDRGVTHELVRHRLAAFSQESTRYCDYASEKFGGEVSFVQPPFGDTEGIVRWCNAMEAAERTYQSMRRMDVPAQIARAVLPNSLKTEIGVTCNAREWRHVLRLRMSPKAHPQMRHLVKLAFPILLGWYPVAFEEFQASADDCP